MSIALREPPQEAAGAAPALVVATRGAERRSCPRHGPSPKRWPTIGDAARGAAGGGGARDEPRPTGTQHSTSGDAAGAVACSSGVAGGSNGRVRGCRGSLAVRRFQGFFRVTVVYCGHTYSRASSTRYRARFVSLLSMVFCTILRGSCHEEQLPGDVRHAVVSGVHGISTAPCI